VNGTGSGSTDSSAGGGLQQGGGVGSGGCAYEKDEKRERKVDCADRKASHTTGLGG
jgi:hypothetical protein